jgi:hypothetical protein
VLITAIGWHIDATAQAASQPMAAESSTMSGVTVKVKPKALSDAGWEFAVVLDTHTQELSDDLTKSSVLVVDGREFGATGWVGAGPGGHHREGVLKFAAPERPATSIELRIQRAGEAAPRVFRWEGAALR